MKHANLNNLGDQNTPLSIKNARRGVRDALLRLGQPVLHLHAWNFIDVQKGIAKQCPCISTYENQPRSSCPVCFGTGFVSVENEPGLWIDSRFNLTDQPTDTPAPKYGGFDDPTVTWVIEADVPTDIFKLTQAGVLTKVQTGQSTAFWDPVMQDGDIFVEAMVGRDSRTVVDIADRYQLSMVTPQTIRGEGQRQRSNHFRISQTFEMALMNQKETPNLFRVPLRGVRYGEL